MPVADLLDIVLPPLMAGLAVAATHAPLGIAVLRRGIVFIDLAIAQIVGLTVVLANLAWHEPDRILVQTAAMVSAISAGLLFHRMEKAVPREQEAIIGCCFVVAAATTLLALADHPHGAEEIENILSGQILFVSWPDLMIALPVCAVGFALWFLVPQVRTGLPFFIVFAVLVTVSVQLVGVYVVFASLILPALAVNTRQSIQDVTAILCGVTAVFAGIFLSVATDLPAGPLLVVTLAAAAAIVRFAHGWLCRQSPKSRPISR